MKDLSCLDTIITDNLAVHIDLSNQNSWNLNTGFTSVSLTKWRNAVSDNIFLYDFGLTAFDNGRVNKMYNTLTIVPTDKKLTLYSVGNNTATGGTFHTLYPITGMTSTPVGNYFNVDGGYLQGFFKLKNYNYELLPPRYGSGITIETIINISDRSFNNGYFYLMGARAEDKYVPEFSGETAQYTVTTNVPVPNSTMPSGMRTVSTLVFSGITTSENHYLSNYHDTEVLLKGSSTPNLFQTMPVATDDKGLNGNVIGFYITTDKRIGYTRINPSGLTESDVSNNTILTTGWIIIDIVFKPYEIITDRAKLDCAKSRLGDFTVYVNGRRFWKIQNFNEYYFKGFKTEREKQLGVPYNISWGGGSFGLKNSYHYDLHTYTLFDQNSNLQISTGFSFTTNPFWNDPLCPVPPLDKNITGTTITGDSGTFVYSDPCTTGTTANTVLKIHNVITGKTLNQYNIQYNPVLHLLSNRDYVFTVNVDPRGVFNYNYEGTIGMFFSGETDIFILEQVAYSTLTDTGNTWSTIKYRIRTKDNTGLTKVKVGLYALSPVPLIDHFNLYFDRFEYRGADVLNKDYTKDNGLIQQLYDKSFVGGIQKLRIYDVAFNSQEVLHNALMEAKNTAYGFLISAGGRLVYE